jgi:hypothetical protein
MKKLALLVPTVKPNGTNVLRTLVNMVERVSTELPLTPALVSLAIQAQIVKQVRRPSLR